MVDNVVLQDLLRHDQSDLDNSLSDSSPTSLEVQPWPARTCVMISCSSFRVANLSSRASALLAQPLVSSSSAPAVHDIKNEQPIVSNTHIDGVLQAIGSPQFDAQAHASVKALSMLNTDRQKWTSTELAVCDNLPVGWDMGLEHRTLASERSRGTSLPLASCMPLHHVFS